MSDNFVTLDNIVSSILLEIGDEGNRRYEIKARQWALDEYRRINMHMSDVYLERKVSLDDNNACDIPEESVKLIAVGIYRVKNGVEKFDPFVKSPSMSVQAKDQSDGIYDLTTAPIQSSDIGRGSYWIEDRENGRFFVKNYQSVQGTITDTTSNIRDRIIIRYRTTGVNLGGDIFIPYEAKDFIVASVSLKFKQAGIPVRLTNAALQMAAVQMDMYRDNYTALLYEAGSFYEVRDAIFGRT